MKNRNAAQNRKMSPAYLMLYQELKNSILKERIKEGQKLPSKRQIADDFSVSVITAEHALSLLSDEGYIEPKERSGYFVIYRAGESFEQREEQAERTEPRQEITDTDIPFPTYARIMRKVISEYGEEILIKSPNNGCLKLRKAISDYLYQNRGIEAAPEQIVVGAGAEYLYGILLQLLGRDRIYGIEAPSYEKIEQVYTANGIRLVHLALGANGIRTEELVSHNFDVLHTSPYRSYPSRVSADASKRREYIRWASEKAGRYIIEDDFESEFYPGSKPRETIFSVSGLAGASGNVIYLNTFSKTVSPSIRTGYMVLPVPLLEKYHTKVGFYSCAVPTFEQYVLAELIESGEFTRMINRVRRNNRKR